MFKFIIPLAVCLVASITNAATIRLVNNSSKNLHKNFEYVMCEGAKHDFPNKIPAKSTGVATLSLPKMAFFIGAEYVTNWKKAISLTVMKELTTPGVLMVSSDIYDLEQEKYAFNNESDVRIVTNDNTIPQE